MADTVRFTLEDLEGLRAKLDRLGTDLTDGERRLLAAVLAAARHAVRISGPDVEAYGDTQGGWDELVILGDPTSPGPVPSLGDVLVGLLPTAVADGRYYISHATHRLD